MLITEQMFWCRESQSLLESGAEIFVDRCSVLFNELELFVDCFGGMQVLSTMFRHLDTFPPLGFPYRFAYKAVSKIVFSGCLPGGAIALEARGIFQMYR